MVIKYTCEEIEKKKNIFFPLEMKTPAGHVFIMIATQYISQETTGYVFQLGCFVEVVVV